MTKNALLLLIGGRQTPNFFTAQFLQPDIIVPVASHEAMDSKFPFSWEKTKPVIELNCPKAFIAEPKRVDAYGLKEIRAACLAAVAEYQDAKWTFNATCGTAVMSIAAYEAAKAEGISCWYLDTKTSRVETLVGAPPNGDLYNISIENYMKLYGRNLEKTAVFDLTEEVKKFVLELVGNLELAAAFGKSANDSKSVNPGGQRVLSPQTKDVKSLWYKAVDIGLVSEITENSNGKLFIKPPEYISDSKKWISFFNGGWLEMYVCMVAREANCFDDVEYSFEIRVPGAERYDIDFALTHKGRLLIAECKTGKDAFTARHFDRFITVANQIGGNFVGKLFISNAPLRRDSEGLKGFLNQMNQNQVVVVDGNQLEDLSEILKREAGVDGASPKYTRI